MKRRHSIILTALVLAMLIAGPVSAYSISVSGGGGERYNSAKYLSYVQGIQKFTYQPGSSGITSGALPGAKGSVSAFSSGSIGEHSSMMEFSQRVSVDGSITGFSFSARYDSGAFR